MQSGFKETNRNRQDSCNTPALYCYEFVVLLKGSVTWNKLARAQILVKHDNALNKTVLNRDNPTYFVLKYVNSVPYCSILLLVTRKFLFVKFEENKTEKLR